MKREYTHLRLFATGLILCLLCGAKPAAAIPEDASAAVVYAYQRVGEDAAVQGNLSLDQFREHISELQKDGAVVLPLEQIVDAARSGSPLPEKAVAITFDGAYAATLANAVPVLDEANMPFTVFFASDDLDAPGGHATWEQIKQLKSDKLASFGLLPATYTHMVGQAEAQNAELINRALARSREMLGATPALFSYPYGEYSAPLRKQVAGYSFKAAFGLHSGVVHGKSNFQALPRFTMTDEYGDIDRFSLTLHALPLPVEDVLPLDAAITQNPPPIGFTVTESIGRLSRLSCFASGLGKLPLSRIGGNRIEIRLAEPLTDRRTRINCTLPAETAPGAPPAWRWFGMLLTVPALSEEPAPDAAGTDTGGSTGEEIGD